MGVRSEGEGIREETKKAKKGKGELVSLKAHVSEALSRCHWERHSEMLTCLGNGPRIPNFPKYTAPPEQRVNRDAIYISRSLLVPRAKDYRNSCFLLALEFGPHI